MPGCAALNCHNSTEKGYRLFRFPKDEKRRAIWAQNTRRGGGWKPTNYSCLCEAHFEQSQLELQRKDGLVKPKPTAIPTIFDVPNPPKAVTCKRRLPEKRKLGQDSDINPSKRRKVSESKRHHPVENSTEQALSVGTSFQLEIDSDNAQIRSLKNEVAILKRKLIDTEEKLRNFESSLHGLFAQDQIQYLELNAQSRKVIGWTDQTVERALQLRCAVGKSGYEYLIHAGFPYPSYRTLCRRMEGMPFEDGIHLHLLDALKAKAERMGTDCVLLLDEMQISQKLSYDTSLKKFSGLISKEFRGENETDKLACHVLVFMLRGVQSNWKQPVGHYFTGASFEGRKLAKVVQEILQETHSRGINVLAIISDMGSSNRAMWNSLGVHSVRNQVSCAIPHPSFPEKKVFIIPDTAHLLKNLRNCLLKQDIILPEDIVHKYQLPSNRISFTHIENLIELEQNHQIKLAHKLKPTHTNPSRFEMMKVFPAAQVLSHSTSAALHHCVHMGLLPQNVITTAWFCDFVNTWFDIMNARRIKDALRPNRRESESQGVLKMREMLSIIKEIKYCSRHDDNPRGVRTWKPIQAGIQQATVAILELLEGLCCEGYQYLLTGRFTQDSLENLFSQIRSKGDSHPDSVHVRRTLKLISISKFFDHKENRSSYNLDDANYIGCLPPRKRDAVATSSSVSEYVESQESSGESDDMCLLKNEQIILDEMEQSALYYLAGYIVRNAVRSFACDSCTQTIQNPSCLNSDGLFTVLKESYAPLTHPTQCVLELVKTCEGVFIDFVKNSIDQAVDVEATLLQKMKIPDYPFPKCHDVYSFIVSKYFRLRLYIYASFVSQKNKEKGNFASKSAFVRSNVK